MSPRVAFVVVNTRVRLKMKKAVMSFKVGSSP